MYIVHAAVHETQYVYILANYCAQKLPPIFDMQFKWHYGAGIPKILIIIYF